ncbi:uncharacterized protein LOC133824698 [Humulus lupulus]|uniref:uncharacterized protein LOC133824698 n=1 Tax=Humulus lupulus TaxID=3486 RepID=UPI002B407E3A|nr:uncharacterized protein LOC133824698 [Humulus lupulus]
MDYAFICMDYNGEWKIVDKRIWEWFGTGCNKGFLVDRSIKFNQLVDKVYEKIGVDRNLYEIEITHKLVSETFSKMAPSQICNDSDVEDLMIFYKDKDAIPLYVCVKKNKDKGKTNLVSDGDDDEFGCDDSGFDTAIQVIAPPEDKTKGRPKINRIPSQGKVSKRQYNCGACGQSGHNAQKCPSRHAPSDVRSTTNM